MQGGKPSSYLLMLTIGSLIQVFVGAWDGVEERFRRLAMWKGQYISKGERATLIRSTLSSLSVYMLSLFIFQGRWR